MTTIHPALKSASLTCGGDGPRRAVVLGIDTHQDIHHAAVCDHNGAPLADAVFAADAAGYAQLLAWASEHGQIRAAGVEQTGSYGAGVAAVLQAAGIEVREVNTVNAIVRAADGKSDAIDAYQAAIAVLSGRARAHAKPRTGAVEDLRVILRVRQMAVQQRTDCAAQISGLLVTAPEDLRERLRALSPSKRLHACARLRPHSTLARLLKAIAVRITRLDHEIAGYDRDLDDLTTAVVPTLRAMPQVGPITSAQLAVSYGSSGRFSSEAQFAHATGTAPIPVASGKTSRVRLHRGGDRQANRALHIIVIGRIRSDPDTQAYIERTITRGKTKKEAIRLLKRYLARTAAKALEKDLAIT